MKVLSLTTANVEAQLQSEAAPAIVFFYSTSSGPCRMVSQIIDQISIERKDLPLYKVNVDSNRKTTAIYNIQKVPTLVSFSKGSEMKRREGYAGKKEILALLD